MGNLTTDFGPNGFDAALYQAQPGGFDRYAALAEFTRELEAHGALISGYAIADGEIHRVKHCDDKSRTKNFWYALHESMDYMAGCFGHWKDPGSKTTWTSLNHTEMSHEQRQNYAAAMHEAQVRQEEERKRIHDEVAKECESEWQGYQDAPESHHYLVNKQIKPVPGLKFDGLINLVVPLVNEAGEIRNLQTIDFGGGKRFMTGGEKKGCFFIIFGSKSVIAVVEGMATGWSVHKATGATVYVAFDAGNLPIVSEIVGRRHFGAKIIICGDNDRFTTNSKGEPMNTGLIYAEKAVAAAGPGTVLAIPQFPDSDTESSDFNDLQLRYGGSEPVKAVIQAATIAAAPQPTDIPDRKPDGFEFVDAPTLTANYRFVVSIIKGMIGQNHITFLSAPPASYKSFLALEMAFCVAAGIPFAGRKTRRVPVVYLAGEGHEGVKVRLKALEIKYGQQAPEWLIVSKLPADLLNIENASEVVFGIFKSCQKIRQLPGLIIVDTFHRNFSGDENSARDFGQMLKNLDSQFRACIPDVSFLFVHHTGHGDDKRGRGTSAIKASCDTEWLATRNDDTVTLRCVKFKDGREPEDMTFRSVEVDTGWKDEDGEPVTSLYLDYVGEETNQPAPKKRKKPSARDGAILTALDRAIAKHGIEPPAELKARFGGFEGNIGQTRKVAHLDHWRDQAYPVIDSDGEKSNIRQTFKRSRDKLIELGIVQQFEDYWWRIDW